MDPDNLSRLADAEALKEKKEVMAVCPQEEGINIKGKPGKVK
jgi:hypothetical protein